MKYSLLKHAKMLNVPLCYQVKQSYPKEYIIFIPLRFGKFTFGPKPFKFFMKKNSADKFEDILQVFRPKAKESEN